MYIHVAADALSRQEAAIADREGATYPEVGFLRSNSIG